jgi:hypothetical protein
LKKLPLTSYEESFFRIIPGQMARFTDGSREILFRRVESPTRKLHPSSDCMQASGYSIDFQAAETDADGKTWSQFKATHKGKSIFVKEIVLDGNGIQVSDTTWPDISSWYGSVWWTRQNGPWTAVTISEAIK